VHGAEGGVLTVVVVGGGATGVEMAGALAELRSMALGRTYRSLDPSMSRVVLVERQDRLLTAFDEKSSRYALEELRRRGVEVRLTTAVERVTGTTVRLRHLDEGGGEDLECGLVVWGAGVGPGSLVAALGLETARGRIVVGDDLSVPGRAGVFAVGDVAAPAAGGSQPLPQLAQPAIQGGRHAARQIVRALAGLSPEPFEYRDKGIMATIGRHAAVAEVRSPLLGSHAIRLRGQPAWMAWLALHVVALLGGRNRAAVLLNWAWRYIAWKRGPRVIVGE
jgi:NADH dehydrogenase